MKMDPQPHSLNHFGYICNNVCMYVCYYYVCMYVITMYVCMYVCMYVLYYSQAISINCYWSTLYVFNTIYLLCPCASANHLPGIIIILIGSTNKSLCVPNAIQCNSPAYACNQSMNDPSDPSPDACLLPHTFLAFLFGVFVPHPRYGTII